MCVGEWVCCPTGQGNLHELSFNTGPQRVTSKTVSSRLRHFKKNSIGIVQEVSEDSATVWLIGTDQTWEVSLGEINKIDVTDTGDKKSHKICNICH